jgi:hypothetical protein
MVRKPTPQPLAISQEQNQQTNNIDPGPKSAPSLRSPASPRSPFRFSTKVNQGFGDHVSMQATEEQDQRRNFSSSPSTPAQPTFHKHSASVRPEALEPREEQGRPSTSPAKGGFFSNYKASKSSRRLQDANITRQEVEETMSRDTDRPGLLGGRSSIDNKSRGKAALFHLKMRSAADRAIKLDPSADKSIARRPVGSNSRSDISLVSSNDSEHTSASQPTPTNKRHKPKPFSLLRRPSIRVDGTSHGEGPATSVGTEPDHQQFKAGMKTAPLRVDQGSFREFMNSAPPRNRSEDRQPQTARESPANREHRDGRGPTSFRENGSQGFLSNLKNSKAVNVGRGFLNKVGRSGSTNEREPVDDEHYVLKVINLPLIEQTRKTRISKRLEVSNDKTEFWMPAFPWRAIDYLNFRGTDMEGLYRVPGSGPQIKKWQRRFDEGMRNAIMPLILRTNFVIFRARH